MNLKEAKWELRLKFLQLREEISKERVIEAKEKAQSDLQNRLGQYSYVLSFVPMGSEIDISLVNQFLQLERKLCLPKVNKDRLEVYLVEDLEQLVLSKWKILEPLEEKCLKIPPHQVDVVLVPGLAFDANNHRLGYGKGYYDKFLSEQDRALKWGVCFQEQMVQNLPIENHDIPLDKIFTY